MAVRRKKLSPVDEFLCKNGWGIRRILEKRKRGK
jgi:hypothetical protein